MMAMGSEVFGNGAGEIDVSVVLRREIAGFVVGGNI